MENNASKRIKNGIAAVLLLFLISSTIDFVSSLEVFKSGFKAGQTDNPYPPFYVGIEPLDYRAHTVTFADGTEYTPFKTSGPLVVPHAGGGKGIKAVLMMLSFAESAALIVFLFHLIRFAVRFPRRPVLAQANIRSLRWIAGALAICGISGYLIEQIQLLWLRSHIVPEGYRFTPAEVPASLIVAVILLAMTEILNLAGKLQTEQELTI